MTKLWKCKLGSAGTTQLQILKKKNLYAIAQKCMDKKGQKLYVVFMDFKKAFDSVHHDKLLQAMQKKGVQGKLFTCQNMKNYIMMALKWKS